MNTSILGHRGVRDGVIHTGAVALMLGAALAMNSARAAAPTQGNANDVAQDDSIARPALPAPPAPATRATPAAPPAPAAPKSTDRARELADVDLRMRDAEERLNEAQRRMNDAHERMSRAGADSADIEERLHDAQERVTRAAAEVAAIAAGRAADAMESMPFIDGIAPSRGPVIGVDLDPKSKGGARVRDVSPGGPAEEAGIRADDVIVMVNGKDMKSDAPGGASRNVVRELQAFRGKRGKAPDAKLKVQVLRAGKPKDFEITPRRIANAFVFAPPYPPNSEGAGGKSGSFNYNYNFFPNTELAGLEVTTLTPQLGHYFGTSEGVLVVRAPKNDTYKLQDGDVILSIDGRKPTSGSHITRILSSYQPGEQVTLRVMRDRKTQDIQVTVPDRRQSRWGTPTWVGEAM